MGNKNNEAVLLPGIGPVDHIDSITSLAIDGVWLQPQFICGIPIL